MDHAKGARVSVAICLSSATHDHTTQRTSRSQSGGILTPPLVAIDRLCGHDSKKQNAVGPSLAQDERETQQQCGVIRPPPRAIMTLLPDYKSYS